jgi:hypothetical protein
MRHFGRRIVLLLCPAPPYVGWPAVIVMICGAALGLFTSAELEAIDHQSSIRSPLRTVRRGSLAATGAR